MDKSDFDELIKTNIGRGELFEYITSDNRKYPMYYCNAVFSEFKKEMKEKYPKIYKAYDKGKGSELIGNPPKMASVASSSRFCYLALRNASIEDFGVNNCNENVWEFEKDIPAIGVSGTHPQMDAFIESNAEVFFFEFKCHEMFDSHKKNVSRQYDAFLESANIFRMSDEIPVCEFGLSDIGLFDLKQFITHLAGITSYDAKTKRKVFSYVYFKPDNCESDIFDKLTVEIKNVYNSTKVKKLCQDNNIELRLYYYENDIMDGFEKKKPTRIKIC